jgi:RND family efflux transporter MFP subunit
MRRILSLGALILALALVAGGAVLGSRNTQPDGAPPPKPVTVPVSRGEVLQTVTAPGQLVGTQERMLVAGVGGQLVELAVRSGSVVQTGEIIARLDDAPYETALHRARLQLSQAEAAYRQQLAEAELAIEAGEAQVESARAQMPLLTVAEVNLQNARDAEARAAYEYQKAQDRHWEPPEVVEAYRLEWVNSQRAVEVAQAEYNRIRNEQWSVSQQANALAKDVAQSSLDAQYLSESGVNPLLQLAVDEAEANLAQTVIRAPFDGVVLDVFARPGEQLPAGANLALLTDPRLGEVRTTVIEEDLSLVTTGQAAEIYFDARPDLVVNGAVARIVPQRVAGEARPLYHVYLSLDEPLPQGVYPGMTADASLRIAGAGDVLRLPRALVAARSDGTATVEVWEDGRAVPREITTGLRGDVYLAVLAGLAEGEEVVGE